MENTNYLNYFKDKDHNYIIRRVWSNEEDNDYFIFSGTYSSIYIFRKDCIDMEVEKIFEKISDNIEDNAFKKYKIKKESFLFEKIVGNFVSEEKFNPLFSKMSEEEVFEFQKDSIKIKINVAFEIHIRVEKHLRFKALIETLFGKIET